MDSKELTLKVFGVGGAGCNAVEQIAQSGFVGVEFVAMNTDLQALLDLSVGRVVPLGATLTRGLGAGGDPEVGRAAAEEDAVPSLGELDHLDVVSRAIHGALAPILGG